MDRLKFPMPYLVTRSTEVKALRRSVGQLSPEVRCEAEVAVEALAFGARIGQEREDDPVVDLTVAEFEGDVGARAGAVICCRTSTSAARRSSEPAYTVVGGSPSSDPYSGLTTGSLMSRFPAHSRPLVRDAAGSSSGSSTNATFGLLRLASSTGAISTTRPGSASAGSQSGPHCIVAPIPGWRPAQSHRRRSRPEH